MPHPVLDAGRPASSTAHFLAVSSRLLLWSMLPLAAAITLEVYLVAGLVLGGSPARGLMAGGVAAVFFVVWVVLPRRWTRGALAPENHE